jgi:hypothetical protein
MQFTFFKKTSTEYPCIFSNNERISKTI